MDSLKHNYTPGTGRSPLLPVFAGILAFMFTACSGSTSVGNGNGNGEPDPDPDPPGESAETLHVGFYAEDPGNNPEDPVPGAVYLNIPDENGSFSGTMSFTYLGCQSISVGTVSGEKMDDSLNGEWTGTVDGTSQSGTYEGTADAGSGAWTGTYTVDDGKQHIEVPNCDGEEGEYYIAAYGTWQLFSPGTTFSGVDPDAEGVNIDGNTISWALFEEALLTLVSIVDVDYALDDNHEQAIPWQMLIYNDTNTISVPSGVLSSGRKYVVSAAAIGGSDLDDLELIYYSGKQFTAP